MGRSGFDARLNNKGLILSGLVMSSQECELFNLKDCKRDISNPSAFEMSRLFLRQMNESYVNRLDMTRLKVVEKTSSIST